MTGNITLFNERMPWYYLMSAIYDPDSDGPSSDGKIVPQLNALVFDETNEQLYFVKGIDPVSFKVTYGRVRMLITSENDYGMISIVSYRNDIFRIYYDTRSIPTKITPDTHLIVYGTNLAYYRLVKLKGTPNEKVISLFYDTDGQFTTDRVPLTRVEVANGQVYSWSMSPCNTVESLIDNETIHLEIYNDYGAMVGEVTCFAQKSTIVNESGGYKPVITGIRIESTQKRGNNEIYIMEKQDVDSLMLHGVLTYDDGREVVVDIDNTKCFLYDVEEFVSSWAGLRQPITLKYYIARNEAIAPEFNNAKFITASSDLIVVPNELAASVKISVLPVWTPSLNRYVLHYYLYNTDRSSVVNITGKVIIDAGTFNGNLYGSTQYFTIAVNMFSVDPVNYSEAAVHRQNVGITLQPIAALQRYTIRDGLNSPIIYGLDITNDRRPAINYNSTMQQYSIPTSIFSNQAAFLKSFYYNATPPFIADTETAPVEPSHFILRDIFSGTSLVSNPIPIEDYQTSFNIVDFPAGRLVGGVVIVEFLKVIDVDTTLILYGVPVDVY